MKFLSLSLAVLVFLVCCTFAAQAEVRITQAKLSAKKINIIKFGIVNISNDGKVVTAYEKLSDAKQKQKGNVYKLWVFEFKGKTRDDVQISEILLPCSMLQNAALSPDGKTSIVTAERGSKFIKVDIASKKATVLFEHKKGVPGFRCDSGIIQYYDNAHVGASGYFYDEKDKMTKRAVAIINPLKTGNAIFELGFDSTKFEFVAGDKAKYLEWCDVGKCFFVGRFEKSPGEWLCYMDNGKVTRLVNADSFISLSCGKELVAYTTAKKNIDKATGKQDQKQPLLDPVTYVRNVNAKEPYKVSPSQKMYTYIATSKDGSTVVISDIDLKGQRVSYFYGRKEDNYKMKPIPELQKTAISQLRLAPNGKAYVTWDGSQVIWGELK